MDITSQHDEAVARICRAHRIRRLALFGSRLKGKARPDSDIDLLVELDPGGAPGLIGISAIQIELSDALGQQVDLRTACEPSRLFRDEVLRDAQLVHGT